MSLLQILENRTRDIDNISSRVEEKLAQLFHTLGLPIDGSSTGTAEENPQGMLGQSLAVISVASRRFYRLEEMINAADTALRGKQSEIDRG